MRVGCLGSDVLLGVSIGFWGIVKLGIVCRSMPLQPLYNYSIPQSFVEATKALHYIPKRGLRKEIEPSINLLSFR